MSNSYGKELILDLYGCDSALFTRETITIWLEELCELIDMNREDLHFWDYEGHPEEKENAPDHLVGTSAVDVHSQKRVHGGIQFITTSDIVIHTVERLGECYINIFTCKAFNPKAATVFTTEFFGAGFSDATVITRGRRSKCSL